MAAEVLAYRESWADAAVYGTMTTCHSTRTIGWDEVSSLVPGVAVNERLNLIAQSWVELCTRRRVSVTIHALRGATVRIAMRLHAMLG